MKRLISAIVILGALVLAAELFPRASQVQAAADESVIVEFNDTVRLLNVFLRGKYRIVHDDSKMAEGEPCLSVYGGTDQEKLVVAFHCKPVTRPRADHFIVVASRRSWFEVPEVHEIQFEGSVKAHQVP
jgi:hypothetical protein